MVVLAILLRIRGAVGLLPTRDKSARLLSLSRTPHPIQTFRSNGHCFPAPSFQRSSPSLWGQNEGILEGDRHSHGGKNKRTRPVWAKPWMPTWLVTMRPIQQLAFCVVVYVIHLTVLTQKSIPFPVQLIPNEKGHFQSIGLDSLVGIMSLVAYAWSSRRPTSTNTTPIGNHNNNNKTSSLPSLWTSPRRKEAPWRFPRLASNRLMPGPKLSGFVGMILLVQGYFLTGRISLFWEEVLYALAGVGFPMTVAMHRSLLVLMGHLSWIAIGGIILSLVPRPQPFFGGGFEIVDDEEDDESNGSDGDVDDDKSKKENRFTSRGRFSMNQKSKSNRESDNTSDIGGGVRKRPLQFKWFTSQWDTYWMWWVLGGYFCTVWVFNLSDFVNQYVLPQSVLQSSQEGVVTKLTNPENNDLWASIVGGLAPCWTAPWWEEVLYRGFMLPAMCCLMPYPLAVFVGGVIFSAHHVSATGAIPLAALGWLWAHLYTKSGNLMVTIIIHAMWNSRVFLGNWFGL